MHGLWENPNLSRFSQDIELRLEQQKRVVRCRSLQTVSSARLVLSRSSCSAAYFLLWFDVGMIYSMNSAADMPNVNVLSSFLRIQEHIRLIEQKARSILISP